MQWGGAQPWVRLRGALQQAERKIRSRVVWRRVAAWNRNASPDSSRRTMDNRMMRILTTRLRLPLALLLCKLCMPAGAEPAQPAARPEWEGALGLVAANGPSYMGASDRSNSFVPAFYLRWGRVTLTNAGGFVTRRTEEVDRGLGLDLSASEHLRLKLALRFDNGRSDSDSPALRGLGNVRSTVRARLSAQYPLASELKLGAAWSLDLLGRGGGSFGDLSLQFDHPLGSDLSMSLSTAVTLANRRYLQSWFGVDAEQSAATGYALYEPHAGVRDVAASLTLRGRLGERWMTMGSLGGSVLLGSAADSPLTHQRSGWRVGAGMAYRF